MFDALKNLILEWKKDYIWDYFSMAYDIYGHMEYMMIIIKVSFCEIEFSCERSGSLEETVEEISDYLEWWDYLFVEASDADGVSYI